MTMNQSRRRSQKRRHASNTQASPVGVGETGTMPAAPAPLVLEWCADYHDKNISVEAPDRSTKPSFITARPYTATFVLVHVALLVALLLSGKFKIWMASNVVAVGMWFGAIATLWIISRGVAGVSADSVVFYRIDLEAEHIELHVPSGNRIRIMTLSFLAITSVRPFQYGYRSNTCGLDIGYLDEQLTSRKARVADVVPATLIERQMAALRPALGYKVEETILHDN